MKVANAPVGHTRLTSQTVGNVGLYYVCYRLSCAGWNVMPTARNARGVDVLIYSQDGARTCSIQVKALSRRNPVPLGKSVDSFFGDWVVICRNLMAEPQSFVLKPEEVRRLAHRGEKDGRVSYWLQPREYETDAYREAWARIGTGH